MKSYSKFIIEKKKGTAVASPAPNDPMDPKGRRKIEKKFSNPSNPPKVANPEAPKPSKPEAVKQADVSKQAATYRRAQRVKGATGGKTTGSLSKGTLSFPGDRSGATAKAKSDIEARKGFSDSKSGGLKADETSKYVKRGVRQDRALKQGIPDPFDPKTPKAPARPFKGIARGTKSGSPSMPDPFKSSTTKPKTSPKPKAPSGPGPATSQAIKDIRSSMSRRGIKTTEADVAQRYMRGMQDKGRRVDPDLVGAQGVKASGAKPEMVGKRAPSGSGAKFRAQADATKDISKARSADLDKAIKNLTNTGNVRGAGGTPFKGYPVNLPKKTGTPSTFKDFSQKAKQFEPPKPPKLPEPPKSSSYKLPNTATNAGTTRVRDTQPRTINPSTNKPTSKNTTRSGYKPEFKPQSGSEMVTGGKSKPKVTVNKTGTKPTLTSRPTTPLTDKEKKVADALRKAALSGKDADGNILSTAERKSRFQQSRNPRMAVPTSPSGTSGTGGTGGGSMKPFKPPSGSGGGALATYKPPTPKPQKPPKPTPAQVQRTPRLAAAAKNAPVTKGMLRQMGGRALGLAGSAYDAVSSYQEYKKRGDSDLRAGVKSAFRTGLGYAGGALGGLLGAIGGGGIGSAVTGTAGAIGGYSAGTWLADKVLGATRYERKKKAREKAAAKAAANQK